MALGSLETCRVMYFYLPILAPMRPARSKRNRLLFIRGTADHARANKSKSTKGSCRRFARGRRGEEWPEEETFVRVNQPGNGTCFPNNGYLVGVGEGEGGNSAKERTPKRPVYSRLIKGGKRRGAGDRVKNGIGITGWIESGEKEKWNFLFFLTILKKS